MSNKATEALLAAIGLDGSELFHIVDTDGNSRKLTMAELKVFINTDPTIIPAAAPSRHLRVNRTADQSIANNAFVTMSWSAAIDNAAGQLTWSAGDPTKIVVGAGVTKIKVTTQIEFAVHAMGYRYVGQRKNGASAAGCGALNIPSQAWIPRLNISSAILPVVAGDYIDSQVIQSSGGALNVTFGNNTWMEVEVVEKL